MKFLVDESTGRKVAERLSEEHDVVYLADVDKGAKDTDVLNRSKDEERILITNDKDFGELVVREERNYNGVLLLRLKIDTPDNRIDIIERVIEQHEEKLQNHFIIASEENVRIRNF